MQAQFTKELENTELVATQAGKASPNDAERLELWKSIDGVQSQSGKIYGRSAYSDNSVSEYFSKTASSSSKTSSPVEHQMKDLSEKIDGFVGIAKKVDDLMGLKDVVGKNCAGNLVDVLRDAAGGGNGWPAVAAATVKLPENFRGFRIETNDNDTTQPTSPIEIEQTHVEVENEEDTLNHGDGVEVETENMESPTPTRPSPAMVLMIGYY
ncbi:hypothetical protein ACFE04_027861 [Oxalis oulophora]